MTLGEYLRAAGGRRWKIGDLDCCTFMADWALALGHADPMAAWRGRYAEREYRRMVAAPGRFMKAVADGVASIGMRETVFPREGDLLLVSGPIAKIGSVIEKRPAGGIAVSFDRFAVVTPDLGVVVATPAELPLLKAWTFNG